MGITRSRILDFLQRNKRATVEELASATGLAPASIRRHLDILQRDKVIALEEVRRQMGRPHYVYFLTEHGQEQMPKEYFRLTNMLVQEIAALQNCELRELDGPSLLDTVFARMAERLAASYTERVDGKTFDERVRELIKILQEGNFYPEWERTEEGYRLACYNCPYHQVAKVNRQTCLLDLNFMRKLVGAEVSRDHCQAGGDGRCVYLIRPQPAEVLEATSIAPE